jgi:hypothetical protein
MLNFYRYYSYRESLDNYSKYDKLIQHAVWYHFDRDDMSPIEHIIARSPRTSLRYAKDVIKGRWSEAEQYIKKDRYYWKVYCEEYNI